MKSWQIYVIANGLVGRFAFWEWPESTFLAIPTAWPLSDRFRVPKRQPFVGFGGHMREELADLCHSQWSGWMEYLFAKGTFNSDGTWTMPKWAVDRWTKQMNTQYKDLSNDEKNTDCAEADKFLLLFKKGGSDKKPVD